MWTVYLQLAFRQFKRLGAGDEAMRPGFFEASAARLLSGGARALRLRPPPRMQPTATALPLLPPLGCPSCPPATRWTAWRRGTLWARRRSRCWRASTRGRCRRCEGVSAPAPPRQLLTAAPRMHAPSALACIIPAMPLCLCTALSTALPLCLCLCLPCVALRPCTCRAPPAAHGCAPCALPGPPQPPWPASKTPLHLLPAACMSMTVLIPHAIWRSPDCQRREAPTAGRPALAPVGQLVAMALSGAVAVHGGSRKVWASSAGARPVSSVRPGAPG